MFCYYGNFLNGFRAFLTYLKNRFSLLNYHSLVKLYYSVLENKHKNHNAMDQQLVKAEFDIMFITE